MSSCGRPIFWLASSVGSLLILEARVEACSVAEDPAFANFRPASDQAPGAVAISEISADLGADYGGPGSGDCAHLGTVKIKLQAADGLPLDDRFGARITVVAGKLPAVFVPDFGTKDLRIQGDMVNLMVADSKDPTLEFEITVQLVNASGQLGPSSSAQAFGPASGGCSAVDTDRRGSPALLLFAALLLAGRRRRPRLEPRRALSA